MKSQFVFQDKKKSNVLPASKFSQHAAAQAVADHTAQSEPASAVAESRFGQDFSQVAVHSQSDAARSEVTPSCPLTPTRCPFGGACHTCSVRVQTKLEMNQPGDEYEQQADRVVDQAMRAPEMQMQHRATSQLEPTRVPPIVRGVLNSPGQPLDAVTRVFMESRFEHDFSGVRVHTDAKAAESASAVKALAYTVGPDMVFGEGQYTPHTTEGRRLVAHELTHSIQQGTAVARATDTLIITRPSDSPEREAEMASRAIGQSGSFSPTHTSTPQLARQADAGTEVATPETPEAPRICPVTAIAAYGPPDGPPVGNDGMTADTITGMNCLQTAVTAAGGTMHVTTRFRSQAYQDHLVEVWDKVNAPAHPEAECAAVMQNYATERATHFPMRAPARGISNHTNGTAFDATVTLPAAANLNTIQAGCNLTSPVAGEPWHFES